MAETLDHKTASGARAALAGAALRVAFGVIWAVNAAFVWTPQFHTHYLGYLHNAADGQPAWSAFWFDFWIDLVTPHVTLFVWLTRLAVTALALALLFGFARRTVYVLGALFSLLIWSTAEAFGGPYAVGATNMGVGITYVLIFAVLIAINHRSGTSLYSLDYFIEKRWTWWSWIAEWRRHRELTSAPRVSFWLQALVFLGMALLLFFLIAGFKSSTDVKAPTPEAAAAAMSPLELASPDKLTEVHDPKLPPIPSGDRVEVHIDASDGAVTIASGVQYKAWPFGGTVPGPAIHVRQGQMVHVTLTNSSTMHHSIDFHAAFTPPNMSFADIMPGEKIEFEFEARVPGAFVYHCGTDPVLLHMGNGMYGAIIVDPADDPRPPADNEYVIVQSEWYTQRLSDKLMGPDFKKMQRIQPDLVVFNGTAFQYMDQPLTAKPGERTRIHMVNAGPSVWSAFHMIGSIFDRVYVDGDPEHYLSGIQTYTVAPGGGATFDLVIPDPGQYVFVDHSFAHLDMGAAGILDVREPGTEHGKPNIQKDDSRPAAPKPEPAADAGPYTFDAARGDQLYADNCAVCHQASGEGLAGTFPPLVDDPAVLDSDPTKHIEVILNGMSGEAINGVAYGAPMPPFGAQLSDAQVADIANHERTSWGNKAKLVTADDVKALR